MEHVEYTYTVGMDDAEVESILQERDVGVLSLADGGRAYGVPVNFHYEDGSLYVRLIDDDDSKKMDFLESTVEASFLVYEVSDEGEESWSIVATGTLRRLTGEERTEFDDTTINEEFDPMRVFGEALEELDVAIYEFEAESITGRRTPDSVA